MSIELFIYIYYEQIKILIMILSIYCGLQWFYYFDKIRNKKSTTSVNTFRYYKRCDILRKKYRKLVLILLLIDFILPASAANCIMLIDAILQR